MNKLKLTYIGRDSWSRPVYRSENGNLYVDVDPRKDRKPNICAKYRNSFDGEPDTHIEVDIDFIPHRDTWD